ncbi:MAG: pyridoxal phosphate-dependent aminotransferase family protein [Flavobacteriaceae bacterium]|nr:pyridoxal phosphate-dependent aminotransferase family protein [Flavobacteriaceae bacterium]
MRSIPKKIEQKLTERKADNALRKLGENSSLIDFSSNDYLGFSRSEEVFDQAHHLLAENEIKRNGATGSRLLSGNHPLYEEVEKLLCSFHESEAALIFNSGYDANIGFFSSVPQRGDVILYDEFVHASIRDGIQMSNARSYKFRHNDIKDLEHKSQSEFSRNLDNSEIYIVTESVFSMDGDSPDIKRISQLCKDVGAYLIVDEAHALGVFGENGQGLVQSLGFEKAIFARIVTFGKALGCHGAAILGSNILKQYLINFCRSFIYTTALPPHSLATIDTAYQHLVGSNGAKNLKKLQENIHYFKSEVTRLDLNFIESSSAIHCCVIPGNKNVKSVAEKLQQNGYDVKPILSPTVPTGKERLRFCLHAYNSQEEITKVLGLLKEYIH